MDMLTFTLLVAAYLLGSIPFGLLLAKAMGEGDLRAIGSGNIGATNALRTGNKKLAALTLLLDLLKGTLAVLIANAFHPDVAPFAGLVAVLGHVFPVWLKFKGGKGVATALGIILGLNFWIFLAMVATWGCMFNWKKVSSLSALTAFALAPVYSAFARDMNLSLVILLLAVFIFWTHRENIRRMLRGEEGSFKKTKNNA